MSWINNEITKLIVRTVLKAGGGWFVAKGFLSGNETTQLAGAGMVLAGILHHLWTERTDILKAIQGGPGVWIVGGAAALTLATSGCVGYQTVNHQSGVGFHAILPIGYNGNNIFQADISVGSFKNTQIMQPTGTNELYAPGVIVASSDGGTVNSSLSGTAGTGTNSLANGGGSAIVSGGDSDVITTGDASMTMTNWSTVTTHGRDGSAHGAYWLTHTNAP